jgi:hypothetical protein
MIRKMRAFILMVIFISQGVLWGQTDDFHREIMDMMALKGDEVTASVSFHDVFPKLQRNFARKKIEPEVWQELRQDEAQQVQEYVTQGAFAYRQFLNRDDVASLTNFYASDAGQNYLMQQELSAKDQKAVNQFFNTQAGLKLIEKRDSIALALDQIKKDWSETLFKKKMRQLIKGGHLKN